MVLAEQKELKEWEQQMMANAPGGNVLFAERVRENGEYYLWYEITGKQALDVQLEAEKLGYPLLCEILLGIYGAVEFLEGILLEAEELLLMPTGIFVDYHTGEVYFCYYPGSGMALYEAFRELLEELLTHLDHEDERAVSLAYGIYEDITKGGMNLSELKRLLRLPYEKEDADDQGEQECEGEEQLVCPPKEDGENTVFPRQQRQAEDILQEERMQEEHMQEELVGEQWQEGEAKRENPNRKKKKAAGREKEHRKKAKRICIPQITFPACMRNLLQGIRGNLAGRDIRAGKTKAALDDDVFFFEPEEEEAPKSTHPTVLLAELTRPPEGILRYEGKGPCKDLVIAGDSFVIGSGEDCEGYIPSTTVSRRHARVSKKEGIYFIEDMNSSNGTYVGGELLNYKTKMSLQKNEIVIFADEKFRFI